MVARLTRCKGFLISNVSDRYHHFDINSMETLIAPLDSLSCNVLVLFCIRNGVGGDVVLVVFIEAISDKSFSGHP